MKRLISIALAALCFVAGQAKEDARTKELLDKSAAAFQEAGGIAADFTLNLKDVKRKVAESFDGIIRMKGDKYFLSVPDYDLWFDGKNQWIYLKATEEVNVSQPSKEELQLINPSTLFGLCRNGFKGQYLGEKPDIKGKQVYEIQLTPAKKSDILSLTVQIGKLSSLPHSLTVVYRNQPQLTVYIHRYQKGQDYPDSDFVFDKKKYPQAEIIDLRD